MRTTSALTKVAAGLMESPEDRHWGYPLSKKTGVRSGALYPMLRRLQAMGWLTDGWENIDEVETGRPARRYYELTEIGRRELGAIAARTPRIAPPIRSSRPALGM